MNKKIWLLVSAIGMAVVLVLVILKFGYFDPAVPSAQNQTLPALQTIISNEGGVEVAVTPVSLSFDSSEWSFEVVLDTHSVELSEDMALVSKLVLDSGEIISPSGWEGDPPGGHHRAGVLTFKPATKPPLVTLKILEIGGVPEREFKWYLR